MSAECQIRQRDTLHQGAHNLLLCDFLSLMTVTDSSTQIFATITLSPGLFLLLIKTEQEKTSNKFHALLISPLLPKVCPIESTALTLLKYAQNIST